MLSLPRLLATYNFPAPSFADLGAWILVGVIRAGAAVSWVSGLDSDGVMGQLTFPSAHATVRGMGAVPRLLSWVRHSPLASFGW